MIILHERNDHIYITCGPHWPGVGAVGEKITTYPISFYLLSFVSRTFYLHSSQCSICNLIEVLMLLGGAYMNYHEVQSSQSLQTFVIVMLILSLFFLAMTACTVS